MIFEQCNDGLGKDFEQQNFACYTERDEIMYNLHQKGIFSLNFGKGEDKPNNEYLIICSFKENNDYWIKTSKIIN